MRLSTLPALCLLVACGDARKQGPSPADTRTVELHHCTVTVSRADKSGAPHEGKAELAETRAEACTTALLRACEAAGEKGDCVASGVYTRVGEISGAATTVLHPPQ